MRIAQLFTQKSAIFSLEVFPPKKNKGNPQDIYQTIEELAALSPDFISVTYGAGGNPSDNETANIASHIQSRFGLNTIAHLTCVNSSKEDIQQITAYLEQAGVENILALRGDRTEGVSPKTDFHYASELIAYLKANHNFGISAACYPERHSEAPNWQADIDHLKEKVDAGATHLLSQLFFDNQAFYLFRDRVRARGIQVPMEAGIMPILNKKQIERMVSLCGASIPQKVAKMLNFYALDEEGLKQAAIQYAIEQIRDLLDHGVEGIHLYTMNNANVAKIIYEGVRDKLQERNA